MGAEIHSEDSVYVPLDNLEVTSSNVKYFACNSKKGNRAQWSLVCKCGPWSVTEVNGTKNCENAIVSLRKLNFHNISCILFILDTIML